LIFKDIPSRRIWALSSQALDFSGSAAQGRLAFNKVIHKSSLCLAIPREIKDLAATRKAHPKLPRASSP
jgi:hypothetical protein